MAAKRKASAMAATVDDEPVDPSDELAFYCLGGGNEVGRSCHIIQYKGKTVMVSLGSMLCMVRFANEAVTARRRYASCQRRIRSFALLRRVRSQYRGYTPTQPVRHSPVR
jgi:hypothetical protein